MAIGSFLFEGSTPPPKVSAGNVSTAYPPWFQQYQRANVAKADALANAPYTPYGGQRLAGTTPDQQAAYAMTRSNVGRGDIEAGMAKDIFNKTGNPALDQGIFQSYMSPYLEGVVGRIAELGGRNLRENLLPSVGDEFIRAGQFGSSRQGDFAARALRDTQESVLGQQIQALQAGHEAAMSGYQTGMGRAQAGGQNMAALAQQLKDMGLSDAAAMEAIGQAQQVEAQRPLDLAYQQFQEQRDYPKEQVNWINNVLYGQQLPTQTSSVNTQPAGYYNPSPLQQFAGTAAGLYGSGVFSAKGGRVNGYKHGGKVIPFRKGGAIARCEGGMMHRRRTA